MSPMASIHADHALRLANERLDGLRAEARLQHSASAQRRGRFGSLRQVMASVRAAFREVEVDRPTVRLTDYPYRA